MHVLLPLLMLMLIYVSTALCVCVARNCREEFDRLIVAHAKRTAEERRQTGASHEHTAHVAALEEATALIKVGC